MINGRGSGFLISSLEELNELFYTYDDKGIITYVNKKLVEVLGYKIEEVVGKPVWEFVPRRFRNVVREEVGKRLREGYKGIYLIKFLHKDGTERVVREKASPIIKEGCITGEMVLCEDITEQRRAQKLLKEKNESLLRIREELTTANQQLAAVEEEIRQQLEESEKNQQILADARQELEAIFNFSPDPMFMINTEGKVIKWNQAMEEMTGVNSRDIWGKGDYEYAISIYGYRRPLLIDLVLNPEKYQEEDFLYVKSDNQALFGESFAAHMGESGRYLAGKSSKIYDHQGNLIGAIESFRDITEGKRAEEALRQSEEKYRNIIESIDDGYFEVNYAGYFTFVNPALCRMLDYSEEELLGENYKKIMDEENAARVFQIFNRVYRTGIVEKNFGYYITGRTDDSIFVEGAVLPISSGGQVTGFRAIIRDISERKRAEEALRQSEEKYRNIIESIDDGYFEVNYAGYFTFVNPALCSMLDYSEEELLGENYKKIMDEENALRVFRIFNQVYTSGQARKNFGYHMHGKKGISFFVEGAVLPIISEGEVRGFRGLIRDMSERKRAEEALQRSERRLREQVNYLNQLMENMNELFFTIDTHGIVSFVNQRVVEADYSPEDIIGRYCLEFVPERYIEMGLGLIRKSLEEGSEGRYEIPLIKKGGQERIYRLNVSTIVDEQGVITGAMCLAEDITEKKLAEEALRLSEARYRAVVEDQTEMIMRLSADLTIIFVNRAYNRYFGREYDNTVGVNLLNLLPREYLREVCRMKDFLSRENPVTVLEGCIKDDQGKPRWQEWTTRAIFDKSGELVEYQGVGRDITERKETEEKLRFLSLHDSLTGLYNRNYFEEQMRVLEDGRHDPLALIICDVDGLKMVNDSLGHAEGDRLLKAVATVLTRCFRKSDILARVGGDEFAVLLPDTSAETVQRALSRVRDAISKFNEENEETLLSISLGYVIRENGSISMNELFKEADNNMYREKIHSRQSIRSSILNTLLKALVSRDYIGEGHGERIEDLAVRLALLLGFDEETIKGMRLLANFHDIGKVGVPDEIIQKNSSLTAEERSLMQRHCEIGYRIALSAPELSEVADYILKHHEWWDGRGYPLGLRGEEIPLPCRILSIIDAFDAMTHKRPYRTTRSEQEAIEELKRCSGSQFDPELVDKFIEILHDRPGKQKC